MLSALKNKLIKVDAEDVISYAREQDLQVWLIEDFRHQAHHYSRIEQLMEDYRSSFARFSALGGLTTGIGGFTTSITFATLDTISLSIQLYRLAQRFAILNGFDADEPLQRNIIISIYFKALGINAVTQAMLKHQLLKASAVAESGEAANHLLLRLVIRTAQLLGEEISSKQAGRLIPFAGGLLGASVNYSMAKRTSKRLKEAFTEAYFNSWYDEE